MILSKKHGIGAVAAVAPAVESQIVTAGVDVRGQEIGATVELHPIEMIEDLPTESTVLIEAPIRLVDPKSHHTRFLNLRLSRRQSTALQMLWSGVRGSHEELDGGKLVDKKVHAVQWLLDKIADAASL